MYGNKKLQNKIFGKKNVWVWWSVYTFWIQFKVVNLVDYSGSKKNLIKIKV